MFPAKKITLLLLLGLIAAAHAGPARHRPAPGLVMLGAGVVGALYQPAAPSSKAGIGVMVMHAEGDYLQFSACSELSGRGYTVLCANNSFSKEGQSSSVELERFLLDAKKAVQHLREQPGIQKVVLLGHSGGGAMLAAYQNIAENGLSACQGKEKILPCSNAVDGLPKADGIILLDANYGLSTMTLLSLNPAIMDERQPEKRDPALSLFVPENGYSGKGAVYSPEFVKAFQQGMAKRMNRLIAHALGRRQALLAGQGQYQEDEPLVIADAQYLGMNNRLFSQDPRFLSRTGQAWNLVHADGSSTRQIIHTLRPPKNLQNRDGNYGLGALKTSVNRFLGTFAIRVDEARFGFGTSGFTGVDWASTHTSPISAVRGIHVPLLTLGMTGNWEFLAAEKIHENAASQDKTLAFIEGASHVIAPCRECGGNFGDTVKTTYDFIDRWLAQHGRFVPAP